MAPARAFSHDLPPMDGIPPRDEFFATLRRFGRERGINIDFDTKVHGREVDLYELYRAVMARGGYDAVSAERLVWRRVAQDFELGSAWAAAYAFALKGVYYRNLAAYEIKFYHGKEPPPVEILENLTAKGGNLLTRTVENFTVNKPFDITNEASDSDADDRNNRTDRMHIDDHGNAHGRSSRGLRQLPPQRVLFQPDMSASSRQGRYHAGHDQSPKPPNLVSRSSGGFPAATPYPSNLPLSVATYEPRPQIPLTLRPMVTPNSNHPLFQAQVKRLRDAKLAALGLAPSTSVMKPGAGFEGPNIYVRILNCLRCPIPEEQDYALHHMVKISHERGDKYRFDSFPGLAEGLLEYLFQASSLFYDVDWQVSYQQAELGSDILDGIDGTPDVAQKMQHLPRSGHFDDLSSPEKAHKLSKLLEAGLTLRNLAMLEDNALYLSDMAQLKDFLNITLNLPNVPAVVELKHYALDISEQVVRYWKMTETDSLYQTLIRTLNTGLDRGAIVTSLRALCRISMNLEEANPLPGFTPQMLERLFNWILLEDEEIVGVCLDLLYQYTALPQNVLGLLLNCGAVTLSSLSEQLLRLMQFRAIPATIKTVVTRAVAPVAATEVPDVSKDLMDTFIRHDEPDRSKLWLRSVFEEEPNSHVTQIALWQAYQNRFIDHAIQTPLLPAADFIKNVSSVFAGANAQVIPGPHQKFIIKGIRPRHSPIDPKGRLHEKCLWIKPNGKICGEYCLKPHNMLEHLLSNHIGLTRMEGGSWITATTATPELDCRWAECNHFARLANRQASPREVATHVRTHVPDTTSGSTFRQKHNRSPATQIVPSRMIGDDIRPIVTPVIDPEHGREATFKYIVNQNTSVDEYGNPSGLSLASALIVRNLARNIPKAVAKMDVADHDTIRLQTMDRILGCVRTKLMYVAAHNRPMAGYASDILNWIDKGSVS